ncbi:IS4 family transposase [Bythopirellula polymerisocia]|uniref:Transposase DDE domain protein n=1 Tax=Bythopirellula polymerisocia TaxID=2528003 RepID=A0A5C6CYB7_9BACT|nr:IS4 family transposase [Bythopirellula polymerisocia]TWU27639.1 Transposase DDE domain protein [Bythopirellula polymerisocia]
MHAGRLVFSQLMEFFPWRRFQTCVRRYGGDHKIKTFPCSEQLRVMAFAQLTYRESLRDIETCLRAVGNKLYHMGIRSSVSRNNLSHANHARDWRIYADFAQILIHKARSPYASDDLGIDLDATVYALDASTINLCLSMFPWARFRQTKGAVKLHTLLNLQGNIPEFILISDGKLHDVNVLDHLVPSPGAYYVMDRGYLDFTRLYQLHQAKAYFVTRAKKNLKFQRRYSHEVHKQTGVQCDQTIVLETYYSFQGYPEPLRRIRYYDQSLEKRLVFLTNNFDLPATTIATLYKSRWQIELFFKWIKQHLRIKSFYGTSQNAVKAQIWTAVSVYLLVAIVKNRLGIKLSLYTILQILSVSIFEKTPLVELNSQSDYKYSQPPCPNQLLLFD